MPPPGTFESGKVMLRGSLPCHRSAACIRALAHGLPPSIVSQQSRDLMVLNAIYEKDFLGFSYGFRPGHGPHDARDALVVGITKRKVNHILDV
jgi:hypothetical protein